MLYVQGSSELLSSLHPTSQHSAPRARDTKINVHKNLVACFVLFTQVICMVGSVVQRIAYSEVKGWQYIRPTGLDVFSNRFINQIYTD